jgi:hypothetical protein
MNPQEDISHLVVLRGALREAKKEGNQQFNSDEVEVGQDGKNQAEGYTDNNTKGGAQADIEGADLEVIIIKEVLLIITKGMVMKKIEIIIKEEAKVEVIVE